MSTFFDAIRQRVRVALLALAAAAALVAWAISAGGVSSAQSKPTLRPGAVPPDLAEQVPSHLEVMTIHSNHHRFYALAFQAVAENISKSYDGELYIVGHRASTSTPTMTADEYINIDDAHGNTVSQQVIPKVGKLVYERFLPGHNHWHLVAFEIYTLERARDYSVISRDHKIGFCVGNDVRVSDPGIHSGRAGDTSSQQGGGLITYKDDTPNCGRGKPNLKRIIESLNAANGDVYQRFLGGQNVDITSVPNGRYVLALHVNPANRIVETNYNNDYASLLVSIHRAKPGAAPTFKVLKRCPHQARCSLP